MKVELKDIGAIDSERVHSGGSMEKHRRTPPEWLRQFLAEFVGCIVLMVFGVGANAQYVLGEGAISEHLVTILVWGLGGVTMGTYLSASISGGHLNPAYSVAMAAIGRLPWRKLPLYTLAQLLGCFIGTACVFGIYSDSRRSISHGNETEDLLLATQNIFNYPGKAKGPRQIGFVNQVFATALLTGSMMSLSDRRNLAPKPHLKPFILGWIVVGLGVSFSYNFGFSYNPAKEIAPRLFILIANFGTSSFKKEQPWVLLPIAGQFLGGILGAILYLLLIEMFHPLQDPSSEEESAPTNFRPYKYLRRYALQAPPWLRECLAEFIGTFVLCAVGIGSVAQYVFGRGEFGRFVSVNLGWGMAVTNAVYWSGGVSGAHLNPAVTLALVVVKKFPPRKLPLYVTAQMLGAFLSSVVVYYIYSDALNAYDQGYRTVSGPTASGGVWSPFPQSDISNWSVLGDQTFSTALMIFCIFGISDSNLTKQTSFNPLIVGFLIVAIGGSFAYNCGYGLNPARELGPRIFLLLFGWGVESFSYHNYASLVQVAGQLIGAVAGSLLHRLTFDKEHRVQVEPENEF